MVPAPGKVNNVPFTDIAVIVDAPVPPWNPVPVTVNVFADVLLKLPDGVTPDTVGESVTIVIKLVPVPLPVLACTNILYVPTPIPEGIINPGISVLVILPAPGNVNAVPFTDTAVTVDVPVPPVNPVPVTVNVFTAVLLKLPAGVTPDTAGASVTIVIKFVPVPLPVLACTNILYVPTPIPEGIINPGISVLVILPAPGSVNAVPFTDTAVTVDAPVPPWNPVPVTVSVFADVLLKLPDGVTPDTVGTSVVTPNFFVLVKFEPVVVVTITL